MTDVSENMIIDLEVEDGPSQSAHRARKRGLEEGQEEREKKSVFFRPIRFLVANRHPAPPLHQQARTTLPKPGNLRRGG